VIVLTVIFVISAGLLLLSLWDRGQGMFPERNMEETFFQYDGKEYVLNEDVDTLLVLGLDKFESGNSTIAYNNDKAADFLMLFVFDNANKTCSAIQINRDTMADVHLLGVDGSRIDTVTKQIALSHTYGNGREVSCRNTAEAVSSVLFDVPVKHYVSMTMDAVPLLNDAVGGVTVEVLDDFTGVDSTLVKGQNVTLRGEQALTYIRSRQGLENSTNINRMKRQQQYIKALYAELLDAMSQDEEFVINTVLQVEKHIVSDRTPTQLQDMAKKFREYEFTGIQNLAGESKKGMEYMEFHVDEETTKKLVAEMFYQLKESE
jgi:LCP family protein required for cell wall assembly